MRILILGDVMGLSGRKALKKNLSNIIKENEIDFSVINGENSADDGKGITKDIADEFLNFSKKMGDDLITPNPEYGFPGLVSGNYWCLCAQRWEQARKAGKAPKVRLRSTNRMALKFCICAKWPT